MRSRSMFSFRPRPAGVIAVVALVFALGGTAAASGYVITRLNQIKPSVVSQLRGAPVYAVYNDSGITTTGGDNSFHTLATLRIPAAGDYTAVGKVRAFDSSSNPGRVLCRLIGQTASGGTPDFDTSDAFLAAATGPAGDDETLPLEVVHAFSGRGTFRLACQQNGTSGGGATLNYSNVKIIATKDSSLRNVAVTH